MRLQEITDLAKSYLNLEDINETGLKQAANSAVKRIVSDYILARYSNKIKTVNNRISFLTYGIGGFTKKPMEIINVLKNNIPAEYKIYSTYIEIPASINNEEYTVEYSYVPEDYNTNDEVAEITGIPVILAAYLTVYEYLTMFGNFEDATIYEKKFTDGMRNIKKNVKNIVLKKRNWFY